MDTLKGFAEKRLRPKHEEDFVDRANFVTTPFMLATAAMLIFAKEYGPFSEPIYCWTQAEWTDDWLQYAHDYCFVESTYYVPMNQSIPLRGERNNGSDRVSYYQWIPFILVLMAIACQLPTHLWRMCNNLSGKNLQNIVRQAHEAVGKECERSVASGIGQHLLAVQAPWIGHHHDGLFTRVLNTIKAPFSRNTLSFFYLFMKAAFFVNNIAQFLFISYFLGVNHVPTWGFHLMNAFISRGKAWDLNGLFPRVSLCDFRIRMPHEYFDDYTVQCVLMANFLNEKIFLCLYWWFVFMAALTLLNFFHWLYLLFRPATGKVVKMVELSAMQIHHDPELPGAEHEMDDDSSSEWEGILNDTLEQTAKNPSLPSPLISSICHNRVFQTNSSATSSTTTSTYSNPPVSDETEQMRQKSEDSSDPIGTLSPSSTAITMEAAIEDQQQAAQQPEQEMTLLQKWAKEVDMAKEKRMELYYDLQAHQEEFVGLLGKDGLLTAQLIRANASPQMASLVVGEMFCAFVRAKKNEAKRKARKDMQKHKKMDNYATIEAGGGTLHM